MTLVHGPMVGIPGNGGYEVASKDAWSGGWSPDGYDGYEGGVALVPAAAFVGHSVNPLADHVESDDGIEDDDRWQHGAQELHRGGMDAGDDEAGATSPQLCKTPSERGSPLRHFQHPRCEVDLLQQGMVEVWEWPAGAGEYIPGFVSFGTACCDPGMSPQGDAVAACGGFITVGHFAQGPPTPSTAPMGCDVGIATSSLQSTPQPHTPPAEGDATGAWVQIDPNGCTSWTAAFVPIATAAGLVAAAQAQGQSTPSAATSHAAHGGCNAMCSGGCGEMDADQIRAEYEWEVQRQDEELAAMHRLVAELEMKRAEVRQNWEREREAMMREVARYREIMQRYCIPLEEACDRVLIPFANPCQQQQQQCAGVVPGGGGGVAAMYGGYDGSVCAAVPHSQPTCSLDAKMQKLNGLLTDRPGKRMNKSAGSSAPGAGEFECAGGGSPPEPNADVGTVRVVGCDDGEEQAAASDVDARGGPGGSCPRPVPLAASSPEVADRAAELEQRTQSEIDERARKALQSLPTHCALEALQKVDDLVESQGGRCRNLSSILQSTCRKLERRAAAAAGSRGGAGGASRTTKETLPASGGKEDD